MTEAEFQASIRRVLGGSLPLGEVRRLSRYQWQGRQVPRYRVGRVFVAGDAAHLLASSGPSLNLGMLDSVNLGWKLAAAVQGSGAGACSTATTANATTPAPAPSCRPARRPPCAAATTPPRTRFARCSRSSSPTNNRCAASPPPSAAPPCATRLPVRTTPWPAPSPATSL